MNRSLERDFVQFLRRHDFPPTEHNVLTDLGNGDAVSLDVLFRPQRLAIELDGGAHETKERFHEDRRRDRRVNAALGILTHRVTSEDLRHREAELAADLWTPLRRRTPTVNETPSE